MRVSITDPGMTLVHSSTGHLRSGRYIQTGGISASAKEDSRGEESKIPSPQGRKRAASEDLETMVSKRGKKFLSGGPTPEGILTAQCPQGDQPSTELQVNKSTL